VKWMIYTVEQWRDVSRRQGQAYGSIENAIGLADLLRIVIGANDIGRDTAEDQEWNERGRMVRENVDAAAR
jgi:nuclear pore complex protein Nup155